MTYTDLDRFNRLYEDAVASRRNTLGALVEALTDRDDPSVAYATTWKVTPALIAEAKYALLKPAADALEAGRISGDEVLDLVKEQATRNLLRARADGSTSTGDRLAEHAALEAAAYILDRLRSL